MSGPVRNTNTGWAVRWITVKRAIKHAPDCDLARALYGEWP